MYRYGTITSSFGKTSVSSIHVGCRNLVTQSKIKTICTRDRVHSRALTQWTRNCDVLALVPRLKKYGTDFLQKTVYSGQLLSKQVKKASHYKNQGLLKIWLIPGIQQIYSEPKHLIPERKHSLKKKGDMFIIKNQWFLLHHGHWVLTGDIPLLPSVVQIL